ncbi:MAG: hypothetical protein LUC83_04205, partial [Clostridiales bacterium]|nr:hypothetical protein [Clostridiales bacterium]
GSGRLHTDSRPTKRVMKNNLKKVAELTTYGIQFKRQLTNTVIFLILGLLFQALNMYPFAFSDIQTGDPFELYLTQMTGVIILTSAAAMVPQILLSLSYSHLVRTSPSGKKLQTGIFCNLLCVFSLVSLTLRLILCLAFEAIGPVSTVTMMQSFLLSGFMAALLIIFWPFTYKYYVVYIIAVACIALFMIMTSLRLSGRASSRLFAFIHLPASPAICIAIAYAACIAASGVSLLIAKALYKKPLSKHIYTIMINQKL